MRGTRCSLLRLVGVTLLAMLAFASPATAVDHDDDEFGSYVHEGTCDALGSKVDDIEDLEQDDEEEIWAVIGQDEDQPDALWGEDDDVDMSLDELMSGEYVVTVLEDDDSDSAVIACGAIAGDLDDHGGLMIDLDEVDGSGYEGLAYLVPDDDDEDTDITLGVWEVQAAGA
jgi:hypothetical protein